MRYIFIGSSTKALPQAREIGRFLDGLPNVTCRVWPEIFLPGIITLEALEDMMGWCSGAVIVASPDEETKEGEQIPRANVIFELGILSARLGRDNVAVCKYKEAKLPSDLLGFTYIDLGSFPAHDSERNPGLTLNADSGLKLEKWAKSLQDTPAGVPRTDVYHGYSGRWHLSAAFSRWRLLTIESPSSAMFTGELIVTIPADGQDGYGYLHGELVLELRDPLKARERYSASFDVSHILSSVRCSPEGSLTVRSSIFSRQQIRSVGEPWHEEDSVDNLPSHGHFKWELAVDSTRPGALAGTFETEGDRRTLARIEITR